MNSLSCAVFMCCFPLLHHKQNEELHHMIATQWRSGIGRSPEGDHHEAEQEEAASMIHASAGPEPADPYAWPDAAVRGPRSPGR